VVKVVLGKVLHQGLRFSPFSIIPPILHTHLDLNTTTAIPEGQESEAWEPSDKALLFRISGIIAHKSISTSFLRASSIKTTLIMIPETKRDYNEYKILTFINVC
jgi:hypothetical protein